MKVTIKDIAQAAGVSFSTVSKALNGESRVNEGTRKKIMHIAQEMNYIPNLAAKRLVDRSSDSIGLIWPRYKGLFFYHLCCEIQRVAEESGYTVMVSMADPVSSLRSFNEHFIENVLVWAGPGWLPSMEFIKAKENFHGMMLLLGGAQLPGAYHISIDRKGALYLAVKHLRELGHRRITFIGQGLDKQAGFTQGVVELGLEYHPQYMIPTEGQGSIPQDQVVDLLRDRERNGITAMVLDNHSTAVQVLKIMQSENLSVPDDCSIVVYDDIPEMEHVEQIAMTTVGPSIRELAEQTIRQFSASKRNKRDDTPINLEIKSELKVRSSTSKRV